MKVLMHIVYRLHVSATHLGIFREIHFMSHLKLINGQQTKPTCANNNIPP